MIRSRFSSATMAVCTTATALTMGMGSIFKARKIIVMANGAAKKDAVSKLLLGKITTDCPVTFLNLHQDVTVICDKLAYGK